MENLELELLEDVNKPWNIKNDDEAEWIIEKYNEKLIESARYRLSLENKIKILQEKLTKLNLDDEQLIQRRNSYLIDYFDSLDDKFKKKTKTQEKYRLPSGEIIKKYPAPEFKRDADKLLKWIDSNNLDEYVEVKRTPKWAELKKVVVTIGHEIIFEDTGEIVEGVELIARPPVIDFKEE